MRSFFSLALLSFSLLSAEESANALVEEPLVGVSANPGAVNLFAGTGALGRALSFKEDSPIRLGGLWIGDTNYLLSGGLKPKSFASNSLFQLNLAVDIEKLIPGGLFGVEFLQFNGNNTNVKAGAVQGYNNITGLPPLHRSELYQLWYRQKLFNEKLILRIGKTVTTDDFNNVLRPVGFAEEHIVTPSTSSLIYTPMFVNPTLIGASPGYYNSAYGITAKIAPVKASYLSYGIYDGNLARGKQTGIRGPEFNRYRFQIAETGVTWCFADKRLPGTLAAGVWHQSGKLSAINSTTGLPIIENGTGGFYLFGTQRLWLRNSGKDKSSIAGFFQYGNNHSKTMRMDRFIGAGLTFFGLTPYRPDDSFGVGLARSRLNKNTFPRKKELMLQGYYQAHLFAASYFQLTFSYIPKPGASKQIPHTWAATGSIIVLF